MVYEMVVRDAKGFDCHTIRLPASSPSAVNLMVRARQALLGYLGHLGSTEQHILFGGIIEWVADGQTLATMCIRTLLRGAKYGC